MESNANAPEQWRVGTPEGHNVNHIYDQHGNGVAQVYGLPMHTDVGYAKKHPRYASELSKAYRIAAVPALYAACKAAWNDPSTSREIAVILEAAIAQAEGKA